MVSVVRDGKRYVLEGHRGEGSFGDLLKWQMEGKRARWPRRGTRLSPAARSAPSGPPAAMGARSPGWSPTIASQLAW